MQSMYDEKNKQDSDLRNKVVVNYIQVMQLGQVSLVYEQTSKPNVVLHVWYR